MQLDCTRVRCSSAYDPVCDSEGKEHTNACIAQCSDGVLSFVPGKCRVFASDALNCAAVRCSTEPMPGACERVRLQAMPEIRPAEGPVGRGLRRGAGGAQLQLWAMLGGSPGRRERLAGARGSGSPRACGSPEAM